MRVIGFLAACISSFGSLDHDVTCAIEIEIRLERFENVRVSYDHTGQHNRAPGVHTKPWIECGEERLWIRRLLLMKID